MKIKTFFLFGLFLNCIIFSNAQQRSRPVEKKVDNIMLKFDAALKLDKTKKEKVKTVFKTYYTDQKKLRDSIQQPFSSDVKHKLTSHNYQNLRKRSDNIISERDKNLKSILSSNEYKKWKEDIETSIKKKKNTSI